MIEFLGTLIYMRNYHYEVESLELGSENCSRLKKEQTTQMSKHSRISGPSIGRTKFFWWLPI